MIEDDNPFAKFIPKNGTVSSSDSSNMSVRVKDDNPFAKFIPKEKAEAVYKKPTIQKVGEFIGNAYGGLEQSHTAATSFSQGVLEIGQDVASIAADIGDALGIVGKDTVEKLNKSISTERAQYENIPYIKDKIIPKIGKEAVKIGASSLLGSKVAGAVAKGVTGLSKGLGLAKQIPRGVSSLAGNISGDVAGGAAMGAISTVPDGTVDRGAQRLQNAAVGGAVGGALGGAMRGVQRLVRGPMTPQNVGQQQQLDQIYRANNVQPTVGQLVQKPGLDAASVKSSQFPFVGGKSQLLKQQGQVKSANSAFIDKLEEQYGKAKESFELISQKAEEAGTQVNLTGVHKAASEVLERFKSLGTFRLPSAAQTAKYAHDLMSNNTMSFNKARDLRTELDLGIKAASKAKRGGVISGHTFEKLTKLRADFEEAIVASTDKIGMKDLYLGAKESYKQGLSTDTIKKIWEQSSSTLQGGEGLTMSSLNLNTFTRNFQKESAKIAKNLTPENQELLKGLLAINSNMSNVIKQVKPGFNVVPASLTAIAASGASLAGAAGPAAVVGSGIKGITYLLNSDAGRSLLTYAGKASSSQVKEITYRLLQGMTNSIVQRANAPQEQQ